MAQNNGVEALKDYIRTVISGLVGDKVDSVEIAVAESPNQVRVSISSRDKDVTGILIGRKGRVANALRAIATAAARRYNIETRIRLDILS